MASKNALRRAAFFLGFIAFIANLGAQDGFFPAFADLGSTRGTKITGSLDWAGGTITARLELDMNSAGLKLPTGRMRAEEILEDEYYRLIRPYLFALQADSSSTVYDLIKRGEISIAEFDRVEWEIQKSQPRFASDLSSVMANYTLPLGRVSSFLLAHRTGRSAATAMVPFVPSYSANYTGIVIIANTSLPIHGRNGSALVKPCLFPKIWDTEMSLIFDGGRNSEVARLAAVYVPADAIFRPTPSGLDPGLEEVVGANPLRIIARGVYGINPTDPLIERDDALLILSSDNNRRLLSENRVIIVLDDSVLAMPFQPGNP